MLFRYSLQALQALAASTDLSGLSVSDCVNCWITAVCRQLRGVRGEASESQNQSEMPSVCVASSTTLHVLHRVQQRQPVITGLLLSDQLPGTGNSVSGFVVLLF